MLADALFPGSWDPSGMLNAQLSHIAWAGLLSLFICLISSPKWVAVLIPIAAVKEFWFDIAIEHDSWGFQGSSLDFSMYLFGMGLGIVLWWLEREINRGKS